jgi:hypothetical protein
MIAKNAKIETNAFSGGGESPKKANQKIAMQIELIHYHWLEAKDARK